MILSINMQSQRRTVGYVTQWEDEDYGGSSLGRVLVYCAWSPVLYLCSPSIQETEAGDFL